MIELFSNPLEIEKKAKSHFSLPDFLMMEQAADKMAQIIIESYPNFAQIVILAGKGNNGGDGYALARLLKAKEYSGKITVVKIEEPKTTEAKQQYEISEKLNINIICLENFLEIYKMILTNQSLIVDCVYGTGFHGDFSEEISSLFKKINDIQCNKIACDIPSGLCANGTCCKNAFSADLTISMGVNKLCFYSDCAKDKCGKIIIVNLGIPSKDFLLNSVSDAKLIEKTDIILPFRKNKSVHKGKFGHTAIFSGKKAGASILCATASINFGSGLTSIIKTSDSDLNQFKISPEIMLSNSIPKKATCLVFGPGIENTANCFEEILNYFKNEDKKSKAAVFDAGVFNNTDFPFFLKEISQNENSRIILTPHLLELNKFCKNLKLNSSFEFNLLDEEFSVEALSKNVNLKIKTAKEINKIYPNVLLIIKSAFTFIAYRNEIFIMKDGTQNLAKGGSGDVLCGLTASLLSQGYSLLDAAITSTETQALISQKIGEEAFFLNQEIVISKIPELLNN